MGQFTHERLEAEKCCPVRLGGNFSDRNIGGLFLIRGAMDTDRRPKAFLPHTHQAAQAEAEASGVAEPSVLGDPNAL